MIRIIPNQPPQVPDQKSVGGQKGGELSDPGRDPFKRRDPRDGGLKGRFGRDGAPGGSGTALSDRSSDFGRRFEAALGAPLDAVGSEERGGEGRRDGRREEPRERVLAVAEARVDTLASLLAGPAPAPLADGPAAAPAAADVPMLRETVAALTDRIEHAYRAELSAGEGRALSLTVPLDGLIEGVKALSVRVTPAGLDVTLTRAHGDAPQDFAAAAQLLASHLQQRFSRRTVRILEAVEGEAPRAAAREGDALSEIGRLLGRSGA